MHDPSGTICAAGIQPASVPAFRGVRHGEGKKSLPWDWIKIASNKKSHQAPKPELKRTDSRRVSQRLADILSVCFSVIPCLRFSFGCGSAALCAPSFCVEKFLQPCFQHTVHL